MSEYLDAYDLSLRATTGDAQAQFDLAERDANGEGVQQSLRSAAYWYSAAAGQGHMQARRELACCRVEDEVPTPTHVTMP